MINDYGGENDIYVLEKQWRDAVTGKINNLKGNLFRKDEEIQIYKERLKEVEAAFYHNLNLLNERDLQLDSLENQLKMRLKNFSLVVRRNAEYEETIKRLEDERVSELNTFKSQLAVKENMVNDFDRRNKANLNALKRIIENLKEEHSQDICQLKSEYEREISEIKENCNRILQANSEKHTDDVNRVALQMQEQFNEFMLERQQLTLAKASNEELKNRIAASEKTETYLRAQLEKGAKEYEQLETELKRVLMQRAVKKQVHDKFVSAIPTTANVGSQIQDETGKPEVAPKDHLFLQQQNEILKTIIKDLKRNKENVPSKEKNDEISCYECVSLRNKIDETNKRFENEVNDLKKLWQEEHAQRNEEESVIQGLESTVKELKERLLYGLQKQLTTLNTIGPDGDVCSETYNREITQELRVTILEHELNSKLERLAASSKEDRQQLMKQVESIREGCFAKLDEIMAQQEEKSQEVKSESLLEKIRQEIGKLESKIESDMKNFAGNNNEAGIKKCDKSLQTKLVTPRRIRQNSPERAVPGCESQAIRFVQNPIPPNNYENDAAYFDSSRRINKRNEIIPVKFARVPLIFRHSRNCESDRGRGQPY